MKNLIYFIITFCFLCVECFGVEPDEILSDSKLEARARVISSELRCLVCRNENIDSSNAELARDLRVLVRERLLKGDSDKEVLEFVQSRYGDFILLRPKFQGIGILLWLVGPLSFLFGCGFISIYIWRKRGSEYSSNLSEKLSVSETKKIKEFVKKH